MLPAARPLCALPLVLLGCLLQLLQAQAQVPANPSNYTRSSSFSYYGDNGVDTGAKNGLLQSKTVEPGSGAAVVTAYTYDSHGNKTGAVTANAGTPTGRFAFAARSSSSAFAAYNQTIIVNGSAVQVPVPEGLVPTSATNALSQSETRQYDPRFGAALSVTGPNGLTTTWSLDDFGRKVRETRAAGTYTIYSYRLLAVPGIPFDPSKNSHSFGATFAASVTALTVL